MKNPKFIWQIFVQIENHKTVVPLLKRLEVSAMSRWEALSAIESDIQGLMQHGDPSILAIHRISVPGV